MNLVIRTESPRSLAPLVRQTVLGLDAGEPVHSLDVMSDLAGTSIASDRFSAVVMTLFGSIALLLATIGLYGVVAQSVNRQKREMGLRMALGADRGRILALVLGNGLRIASVGAGLGILGSIAAGQFLSALLFETSPSDPFAIVLAVAIAMTTVILACLIPARRAAGLDPKTTLSVE
jgi:putative ABC transport system permease protein